MASFGGRTTNDPLTVALAAAGGLGGAPNPTLVVQVPSAGGVGGRISGGPAASSGARAAGGLGGRVGRRVSIVVGSVVFPP